MSRTSRMTRSLADALACLRMRKPLRSSSRRNRSRPPAPILLPVLLIAPFGCDSGPSNPSGQNGPLSGTYTATVTGSVTASLSGSAVSVGSASTGAWGIVLSTTSAPSISIIAPGQDRPPPGTYPIVSSIQVGSTPGVAFTASFISEIGTGSFTSINEGTLTITSSSAAGASGSFSFEAMRGTIGDPSIVQIVGSFEAVDPAGG